MNAFARTAAIAAILIGAAGAADAQRGSAGCQVGAEGGARCGGRYVDPETGSASGGARVVTPSGDVYERGWSVEETEPGAYEFERGASGPSGSRGGSGTWTRLD